VAASMGRTDEALRILPDGAPSTEAGWVGYHIRGMALLRCGRVDDAVRVFEEGVLKNPWLEDRDYFRTGLALARLRQREFSAAARVLDDVRAHTLEVPVKLLRIHARGGEGDCEKAEQAYRGLPSQCPADVRELRDELHRRYVLWEAPQHDDSWLFEREADYLEHLRLAA